MQDLKNRIEALLFSSGKKMSVDEIAKLTRVAPTTVLQLLQELKVDYDSKNSSLLLSEEGNDWKLTVREQYSNVVRKIVAETELTRTVMETLAVIAWKAPVLQSEIIRVRTNKAYDHLNELETTGFISRSKHGRTKLIKLTDRFFRYFDLKNAEEIKERFKVKLPGDVPVEQPAKAEVAVEEPVPEAQNSNESPEGSK